MHNIYFRAPRELGGGGGGGSQSIIYFADLANKFNHLANLLDLAILPSTDLLHWSVLRAAVVPICRGMGSDALLLLTLPRMTC